MTKAQRIVKSVFWMVLISIMSISYSWLIYKAYQVAFVPERDYIEYVKKCGTVVDKKQPAVMDFHKHGADLEVHEYLYVRYLSGVEKENVNAATWYRYQIGEEICFTERAEGSNWESAKVLVGGLIGWILILLTLIVLSMICWHLLGGSSLVEAIDKMWNE